MKEWFKKAYGLIAGVYTALVFSNVVDKFLPDICRSEKSEKEES